MATQVLGYRMGLVPLPELGQEKVVSLPAGGVLWLRTCVVNRRRRANCAVSENVRKIHRIFTEILQRQILKLSNCRREEGARDLYLFKQHVIFPRSGRLGLTGEQLSIVLLPHHLTLEYKYTFIFVKLSFKFSRTRTKLS